MGLLDELEQEAERQRLREAQLSEQREAREQHWNTQLLPAMKALDDFLHRLGRHLASLKKRPRIVYPLPGYGDVVAHVESTLIVQSAPQQMSYDITLEGIATVATEECPRIVCDTLPRVRSVSGVLTPLRLAGVFDAHKNPNGEIRAATFVAKGRIPLQLDVHADVESGIARMQFQNYEGFGHSTRSFRAEQLDEALFDALGRFLMRDETTFAQESVGEDLRRQLQSRLQRDQIKREWEQKLARQLDEDEAETVARLHPSIRPGGLLGRLRMFSRRLIGR